MSQSTPARPTTTQPGAVTSRTGAPRRGRFRPLTPVATVALASLALAACSPAASGSAGDASAEATTASAEAPSRIVGVSSDVSDMALLLAGPERVAAVSESSRSPHMGMVPDLARQVEGTIPAGVEPDAEQILTHAPDLVLTTARHAGERSVGDQLADAGVESLALASDDFATPESYADALLRVGEALGEEDAAAQHADDLLTEIQEIDDAEAADASADGDGPRVLALMARGGTVMAMDGGLMLPGLAVRAGAVAAAAVTAGPEDGGPPPPARVAGITGTAPLDAELLVKADPDILLLEDFMGTGEEPFADLLGSEAVAQVPAVADDEVHLVPMTEASAVAGIHLPDGYRTVAGIVSAASAAD